MQETLQAHSLDGEDPLEQGIATHSSILALDNPMDTHSLSQYSSESCSTQWLWQQ